MTPLTETQAVVTPIPVQESNVSHVPTVTATKEPVVPALATGSTPPESTSDTASVTRTFSRRNLIASHRESGVPTAQIQPVMATPTVAAAVDSVITDLAVETTRAEPEAAHITDDREVCRPVLRRLASHQTNPPVGRR